MNSPTHLSGEITAMELHHWLDSGKPIALLNVMNEDCFAEQRLPGSLRACVYETAFVDQVKALVPDNGASIIVYGNRSTSLASKVAAEKLLEAGYTHLYDFRDGVQSWKEAGYEVEGRGVTAQQRTSLSGKFVLDKARSVVRWTGKNLLNHHEGTIAFSSGEIEVKDDQLVACKFTVDLNSITCADLTDATWNAKLIQHLLDADFFNVARWPEASFTSESAEALANGAAGLPTHELKGELTLRGQTHGISFDAIIGSPDGDTVAGQAELDLDRTRWGVLYGSARFFDRLGGHLVNDLVHLHLKIVATREA